MKLILGSLSLLVALFIGTALTGHWVIFWFIWFLLTWTLAFGGMLAFWLVYVPSWYRERHRDD